MCKNVLLDFGTWDITSREALFSIFMFFMFIGIGCIISGHVSKYVDEKTLTYRQATQIDDASSFRYGIETGIGNAFFSGNANAVDPVVHRNLRGKHMLIDAAYQAYNMHTRTVTYVDNKGRTHSRIETYWTWDTYDRERYSAKHVDINGVELPFSLFSFKNCIESDIVNTGFHRRIVFNTIPCSFSGSGYACLNPDMQKSNADKIEFYKDYSIKDIYDSFTTSYLVVVFWIIWIVAIISCIIAFYIAENKWLEDRHAFV